MNKQGELNGKAVEGVCCAHALNCVRARVMPWAWAALAFVGAILIVLGVLKNDMTAVITKAATVCLECIGIG